MDLLKGKILFVEPETAAMTLLLNHQGPTEETKQKYNYTLFLSHCKIAEVLRSSIPNTDKTSLADVPTVQTITKCGLVEINP